jgi:nitrate/nitrite-specific signal transduction histidine kinase
VRSGDEFGVLGDEFNKLVDTVDSYSRDLEEKVRLRTEELWQLQKENTQLRIAEERRRIYRDMHDTIGPS